MGLFKFLKMEFYFLLDKNQKANLLMYLDLQILKHNQIILLKAIKQHVLLGMVLQLVDLRIQLLQMEAQGPNQLKGLMFQVLSILKELFTGFKYWQ